MHPLAAWIPTLILAGAVGSGLMAGLFFAFSISVLPALARMPPAVALEVMQRVNVAIINPVFLGVFLGTGAVAVVSVWAALVVPGHAWLLAAGVTYLAGVVGVTMAANVPLNNALARASVADAVTSWPAFVGPWERWNRVRLALAIASLVGFWRG